jgi:hypothetical protein
VHPRDPELVIGTHGRSIYIAPLADVRALSDSIRRTPIAFLHADALKVQSDWGKRPDEFSEPTSPKAEWAYYAGNPGLVKIRLSTKQGLILKEIVDTAEAGLNYPVNDLSLEPAVAKKLEAEVRKEKKDPAFRLVAGKDDGRYYPVTGEYKLTFTDANGRAAEGTFELKDPSAKKAAEIPDPESVGPPGK